jgi:hypothetical protein
MKLDIEQETINQLELEFDRAYRYIKNKKGIIELTLKKNNSLEIDLSKFEQIFSKGKPNLYAIYAKENSLWILKYIGETKTAIARTRLRNHFIYKNQSTGSKLEKVTLSLSKGIEIGVKVIKLNDEKLRHYFEEKLIHDFSPLPWNIHGVQKSLKKKTKKSPTKIIKK